MKRSIKIMLGVILALVIAGVAIFLIKGDYVKGLMRPAYDTNKCYDSDGGKTYETEGTAYGKMGARNKQTQYTDKCDGDTLIEYYCDGKYVKSESKFCLDCEEGGCSSVCQIHPGGTLPLGFGLTFGFDDGSEYFIKLVGLQKETFEGQDTFMAQFKIDAYYNSSAMLMYDVADLIWGSGLQMMINDIDPDTEKVKFKLYKDCGLISSDFEKIPDGYSELQCNTYVGPGTYNVHYCDRIKQSSDSQVSAYVGGVGENQIYLKYRVTTPNGEFEPNVPHLKLDGNKKVGAGYFGLNLLSDEYNYNPNNKSATIAVKSTCQTIHDLCMEKVGDVNECTTHCPSEETEGFEFVSVDNKFMAKTPLGQGAWAECAALSLKYGIPNGEGYFGFDYPFPQATAIYLEGQSAVATGVGYMDDMTVIEKYIANSWYGYDQCLKDPVAYSMGKMSDHETNHDFLSNSALDRRYGDHPELEEGLVNYVAGIWNEDADELECLDNGWKGSANSELKPYGINTVSGQCFWKRLENEYGHDKFVQIMQAMDESRYIDPKAGTKKIMLLFEDIINPIIGSDVLEKRAYDWYGFVEEEF